MTGRLHSHADGTTHRHFTKGFTVGNQVVSDDDGSNPHEHGTLPVSARPNDVGTSSGPIIQLIDDEQEAEREYLDFADKHPGEYRPGEEPEDFNPELAILHPEDTIDEEREPERDWWLDVYRGKTVRVKERANRFGRGGTAIRAWYDDGDRLVRVVVSTNRTADRYEVMDFAGNWEEVEA